MNADPMYLAMLKTPEARVVWEKVLEMRGHPAPATAALDVKVGRSLKDNTPTFGIGSIAVAPPHLGELWGMAEQRELSHLQVCKESEGLTGRYQAVGGGLTLPLRIADADSAEAALLSYIVDRRAVRARIGKETGGEAR